MARRSHNAYHDWYIGGVKVARINTRPRAEGYPRTHIKRVIGWHTLPEIDSGSADTPSGRRGEIPYPATTRGKTLTYELQQQAADEPTLVSSLDALRASFADISTLGLLVSVPWSGHGTEQWATFARVSGFDGDEEFAYNDEDPSFGHFGAWKRDIVLSLRQVDGVWFWLNESGTPFTPLSWSGSTGVSVTNSGTVHTAPVITVAGVAEGTDLHVGRDAAGGYPAQDLWFRDPIAAAGLTGTHDVVVDFASLPRQVTVSGLDATASYDATVSDWWDEYVPGVPPGTFNVFRGPGAGTGIEVHFYSTSV